MCKNRFAASMEKLQSEASRLARKHNKSISKFSYRRVRHFMARKNLTIKHQIKTADKLQEQYKEKLVSFQKYVLNLR
jgi:hypothetical protein